MKSRSPFYIGIILIAAVILGFFNLPSDKQKQLIPFTPQFILDNKINLGLDLQGGSQLDYKIDLRKVPQTEQKNIINGILGVINKRVNSLGVAEPNIYTSDLPDEKHIIVELAGIKDLNQAKETVGKTIQLEFKEKKEGPADPEAEKKVKENAQSLLDKVKKGGDLVVLGQEEAQANPSNVFFVESKEFVFGDELKKAVPLNVAEELMKLEKGQTSQNLIDNSSNYSVDASGNVVPGAKGFTIVKVTDKRTEERQIDTPYSVKVRHILVAYKGASQADEKITRTEEEAKKRAEEVIAKLNGGAKFEDVAKEYSDDPSNKEAGGILETPVVADGKTYAKEFQDAAIKLKAGELSTVVQSPFGFHVIKADSVTQAKSEKKMEPQIKYAVTYFSAAPDEWQATKLNGEHFVHADVEFNQAYQPYVSIKFDNEGAKLFEEITEKNVGKPLAIFVGGSLISAPNVNQKITGGNAQISGQFTLQEAQKLATDLNTGAIPAPIVLAGQNTIGATLGQDALNKSLWAGLIGFILVAIFMILFYRLPGLLATLALSIYSIIVIFLIKVALPPGIAIVISAGIFLFLITKIIKNKDSGPEKAISLLLACFILFYLANILSHAIVMTLAGIAGVILSIGMAVDANILIFERIKEELRDGRSLLTAIEVGFDRAWNSIRDSNFSSLITCGILFFFGSSIIQGFAFNLAAGILVSMFTAITITKTFLNALVKTRLANSTWLFGSPKSKNRGQLPIVAKRKILYGVSLIILVASLLGIPLFGLKLGMDFTGGTVMELKVDKNITADDLRQLVTKSGNAIKGKVATTAGTNANKEKISEIAAEENIDYAKIHIVPSESGYQMKLPHISTETHDALLAEMKKESPNIEEIRFRTVGPTVGESLKGRALFALLIASIMIIAYIAFAFRRVPRQVGKWKFGVTAVAALVHDLGIMFGVYVFMGAFLGVEIDALFITALLTVLGFSVHDTIVVFDRIREKLHYQKKDQSFEEIANEAVNETIARSINTSFSVLLTLVALAVFGSESIRYFVISLIVGIVSGTYSSIFVATPLLVDWQIWSKKKKK